MPKKGKTALGPAQAALPISTLPVAAVAAARTPAASSAVQADVEHNVEPAMAQLVLAARACFSSRSKTSGELISIRVVLGVQGSSTKQTTSYPSFFYSL